MCGISGALMTGGDDSLADVVAEIAEYQSPRGPDAQAIERFDCGAAQAVLGHNRLSIIDLSTLANQPLRSSDGSAILVFNGEIYNYKELRTELQQLGRTFSTSSDSEVLVEAYCQWGVEAFDRFIGMFAFAILDLRRRRLVLARDRFGVKPLYYRHDGRSLVFASTPGIIARRAGLPANLDYVARGLQFKYYEDDSDIAPYVGLRALEPSHALVVDLDDTALPVRKQRYYDFAARVADRVEALRPLSADALTGEVASLLDDACRLRLRSDVPVGVSLSGGLDSSSIAAVAAGRQAGLVAFSYGRPDDAGSEGPLAARIARDAGLPVHWIWPVDQSDLPTLFLRTLRAQGAPFPHTSMMAQFAVFERAKAEGVKVVLGGQGGDEAFMGYRKFFLFWLQETLRRRRIADLPAIARSALQVLPAVAARAGVFWSERHRYSGAAQGMATRLVLPDLTTQRGPAMAHGQTIRDRQIEDVTRFSLPTLLRYEDRNSMANSIESRLPFVDHRLLELGVALPTVLKLHAGYGKWALRKAMRGKVDDSVRLSRDKRGFDTQQERWIRSGLGDAVRDLLRADRGAVADFLAPGQTIEQAFGDDALAAEPQAMKEAISLAWLIDPVRWTRTA